MSEVISLNKKKPAKNRTKCRSCRSTFSFLQKEAAYIGGYDGDCYIISCPACGTKNYIAASLVKP